VVVVVVVVVVLQAHRHSIYTLLDRWTMGDNAYQRISAQPPTVFCYFRAIQDVVRRDGRLALVVVFEIATCVVRSDIRRPGATIWARDVGGTGTGTAKQWECRHLREPSIIIDHHCVILRTKM